MQGGCHDPSLTDMKSCAELCEKGPSPYEELGTHQHASDAVLKSNFRKLSLKHHPDKGGEKAKFDAIREAMDVLSDRKLRRVYDMGGWKMVFFLSAPLTVFAIDSLASSSSFLVSTQFCSFC